MLNKKLTLALLAATFAFANISAAHAAPKTDAEKPKQAASKEAGKHRHHHKKGEMKCEKKDDMGKCVDEQKSEGKTEEKSN